MSYTQEQYNELPEWMQKDLVKDGDVYKHAGLMKVKATADELNGKFEDVSLRLSDYESKEAERIAEAERKAYEKAKKEGNVDELERRYQQQIEDAQRRADETAAQFKERLQKLADKQKQAVASELSELATEKGKAAFKRLIANMIQVDAETDTITFLDDAGSATSLDQAGFIAELKNSELFAPLIKSDAVTNGGGHANGSDVGSASKKPEEYTEKDRTELYLRDPNRFKQLFPTAN